MEHLLIPGTLEELWNVHEWTHLQLDRGCVPAALRDKVLLAVSECVTNAIRHGCHEVRTRKVKIECRLEPGAITFIIRDRGHGFVPENVPDPTHGPYLYRAGGRGVYLLKVLSSESTIESSHDGTSVTFRFRWS